MARENPVWPRENPVRGEERIASELFVKLRNQVSPQMVRNYMPKRLDGQPRGDQRWSTLKNHAKAILACDFLRTKIAASPMHRCIISASTSRGPWTARLMPSGAGHAL